MAGQLRSAAAGFAVMLALAWLALVSSRLLTERHLRRWDVERRWVRSMPPARSRHTGGCSPGCGSSLCLLSLALLLLALSCGQRAWIISDAACAFYPTFARALRLLHIKTHAKDAYAHMFICLCSYVYACTHNIFGHYVYVYICAPYILPDSSTFPV